jgi:type I restriction enzyme M protein
MAESAAASRRTSFVGQAAGHRRPFHGAPLIAAPRKTNTRTKSTLIDMDNAQLNWIAGFIWNIADDVLRDVYVRGKYRDVILPMTVIRRLDAVLEPTKDAVLKMNEQLDQAGIANKNAALCQASGQAFYNTSPFTLRDLRARARQQQLKADFEAYLDGFSPNVQEILDKFKFRNQIPTLVEADILGSLIEKFCSNDVNLSPNPVFDQDGNDDPWHG